MSIVDANIKTSQCEKQFFQTLPEQVEALKDYFNINYNTDMRILDAGAGLGNIANGLKRIGFNNVKTNDLFFDSDYNGDFVSYSFPYRFNIVVSNPPYIKKDKVKYQFIDKAIKVSDTSIFLLPLQMLNYIYFCEKYLDTGKYLGRITMYPKVILNPEMELKQGGNTGYGWFFFRCSGRCEKTKFEEFVDTRKYREQLNITSV